MIEHLAGLGVQVERPVEVLRATDRTDHVEAVLRGEDGAERPVRARFLVAADGAHSVIRKGLGVTFPGAPLQGGYVMDGDAEFTTPPEGDRGTFLLSRGAFVVVGLRADGNYRISLSLPSKDPRISREHPTREELQTLLDSFPEFGIRLRSITWSSAFFVSSRHVDRLRHGRIFLAGDSAHTHSPVGGQGMNTGIQDAANLAWKLALALDGRGGEPLLDSYDTERMPIIRRLISSTTTSTKPMLWRNPAATTLRNTALRLLLPWSELQATLFDGFTGFSVHYPRQPDHRPGPAPRPAPRTPPRPDRPRSQNTTLVPDLGRRHPPPAPHLPRPPRHHQQRTALGPEPPRPRPPPAHRRRRRHPRPGPRTPPEIRRRRRSPLPRTPRRLHRRTIGRHTRPAHHLRRPRPRPLRRNAHAAVSAPDARCAVMADAVAAQPWDRSSGHRAASAVPLRRPAAPGWWTR